MSSSHDAIPLVERLPVAAAAFDRSRAITSCNHAAELIFALPREEVIGGPIPFLSEEGRGDFERLLDRALAGGTWSDLELHGRRRDGLTIDLSVSVTPLDVGDGTVESVLCVFFDLTARLRTEGALREAEERFRQAFDYAPIGMALVLPDGTHLQVNQALCEITGYREDELLGRKLHEISHPDDLDIDAENMTRLLSGKERSFQAEKRFVHAAGHSVWVDLSVSLVRDEHGDPLYFVGQVMDVNERKHTEHRLQFMAEHDPLTGVANRANFERALDRAVTEAASVNSALAVLYLDLDNFKQVNDRRGHAAGDELLREVAARLCKAARGTDVVARHGGDEFALLLPSLDPRSALQVAEAVARRISGLLEVPLQLAGSEYRASASIGISIFPDDGADAKGLLEHADATMYERKRPLGDGRFPVTA